MSKVILSTLVAALVCVSNVQAEGISAKTLNAMGLGGLKVMSDRDALAVRGKGGIDLDCDACDRGPHGAAVVGNSVATINLENCPDCVAIDGTAHSENGYIAFGPYYAAGTNLSEAGAAHQTVETVDVNGVVTSLTRTTTVRVFAAGSSSARAF
jgi:hypothetical protein